MADATNPEVVTLNKRRRFTAFLGCCYKGALTEEFLRLVIPEAELGEHKRAWETRVLICKKQLRWQLQVNVYMLLRFFAVYWLGPPGLGPARHSLDKLEAGD